jgi:hypothetical protein
MGRIAVRRKLARLDASEGRQYAYLWVDVEDRDGRRANALTNIWLFRPACS